MNVIHIDIETTGLDTSRCQILQIAAAVDDGKSSWEDSPKWSEWIKYDNYYCDAFVLDNEEYLRNIKLSIQHGVYSPTVFKAWESFIHQNGYHEKTTPICGKNVAKFDLLFLANNAFLKHNHKYVLDLGSMYGTPYRKVPNIKECCEMAGITVENQHDAMGDVKLSFQLLRAYNERRVEKQMDLEVLRRLESAGVNNWEGYCLGDMDAFEAELRSEGNGH